MAWTGQSFSVGQVLTAAQMNNLQADITAAFNKDAGAPVLANLYVVEAMLAAAVSAQLVTNGDSHDHSGGDGAAIPNASVTGLGSLALLNSVALSNLDAGISPWVEIAQVDAGSSTSVTLDGMDSTYDAYMVVGSDIQRAGSAAALHMRVRIASSTKTDTNYIVNGGAAGSVVSILTLSNTSTKSSQFQLLITNPSNTGTYKPITIDGMQGTDSTRASLAARYEGATGAINGLYFFPTSGPFQGGLFTLYGLRT